VRLEGRSDDGSPTAAIMPRAAVRKLRPPPVWVSLAALVGLSTVVRAAAARSVPGPFIAPDEIIYGLLGRSLWASGKLEVLGGPTPFYSFFYPALVGLPLSLEDPLLGFELLQLLQALVMSLSALPVYLWGRKFLPARFALLAAGLTLALPGLAYSALIMTEVLFLPVTVLALWALAEALARPTPRTQALLLAAVAVAVTTRLQALVLVPALLTGLVLKAVLDRSLDVPRRFWPTLVGLGLLAGLWSAWHLHDGGPWTKLLGGYGSIAEASYDPGEAVRFVAYHAGDAVLMTAVFPACAVGVVAARAFRRRDPSDDVRSYLAVVVAYGGWLVVETGVFASRYVERLAERDLLTLAPALFLGFALWLSRGAPRPRLAAALVGIGAAALVLVVPFEEFAYDWAVHDAFTLAPLWQLRQAAPTLDLELVVSAGVAAAVIVFALLPRRLLLALPVLAGAGLLATSVLASRELAQLAGVHDRRSFGVDKRWVDDAANGPVAYLYGGEPYWNSVWQHVFWNRRVDRVLSLRRAYAGPIPQLAVDPGADGRLRGTGSPRYVVASAVLTLDGQRVAENPQEGNDQRGVALWKVEGTPRLATWSFGVAPNGDMFASAELTVFGCRRGAFHVALLAKGSRTVQLKRDGKTVQTLHFRSDSDGWSGSLPAPPWADGTRICRFEVTSDGFLGSSRFEFLPVDAGAERAPS